MSLEKVIAISGKPGLYKIKAQTRNGFVVTSLADGRSTAVNVASNVNILQDIAIYTYSEEVPLADVFANIKAKENAGPAIPHKSSKEELFDYFREVLPEYDEDRVYAGDVKKVIQWYNILQKNDMLDFDAASDEEE